MALAGSKERMTDRRFNQKIRIAMKSSPKRRNGSGSRSSSSRASSASPQSGARPSSSSPAPLFGLTLASHGINLSKSLTGPVYLAAMLYFDAFTINNVVFTVLHGTYGFLWVFKQLYYPDRTFEVEPAPLFNNLMRGVCGEWLPDLIPASWNECGVIMFFLTVNIYWSGGLATIASTGSNKGDTDEVSLARLAFAITIYTLGIFFHFVSDAHKYVRLASKRGLVTDGLFSFVRNPNYLGEMMIYLGFFSLSRDPRWILVPVATWMTFFRITIDMKERSIARYPEFKEWKSNTYCVIPFVW